MTGLRGCCASVSFPSTVKKMPKKKNNAAEAEASCLCESLEAVTDALSSDYPEGEAGEPVGDFDYKWTAKALRMRAKIVAHLEAAAELAQALPEALKPVKGAGSPLRMLTRLGVDEAEADPDDRERACDEGKVE